MNMFPKPKIIVSKCLGFAACRYNGVTIKDSFVENLKPFVEFIPVCPEVAIGLGIPRDPIRIVMDNDKKVLYQPSTKKDLTESMHQYINNFIQTHTNPDGCILKNRSPSCGIGDVKIYNNMNKTSGSIRGSGIFGEALLHHYPHYPMEDEGRLKNLYIREHFLIKLFTITAFNRLEKNMKSIVDFHSKNKLLFMAYHQKLMREMGKIIANHEQKQIDEVFAGYREKLFIALSQPPHIGANINILEHAFGGFSEKLDTKEKHYFITLLEEYRDERIPFSVLTHILESWAIKYDNQYILDQTFIKPFPPKILRIQDSFEKREYTFY